MNRMPATFGRLWQAGLDLLYPRQCPGCRSLSDRDQRHVCWQCLGGLNLLTEPVCRHCGEQPDGLVSQAFTCGRCRNDPPAFDRARAAARFSGVLRDWLHVFKYGGGSWLCPDLTDLLEACVRAHAGSKRFDAVTGVPLHAARQRQRGYNQSTLLGKALARRLDVPWIGLLARSRPTPSQTRLNATARRRNVRDAFRVTAPEWIEGRAWLLVDDVITTGATLNEVARVMRAHGAREIWAFTVARG